ncbi:MAG: sulfite exporter TauE/SafE family protein [Gemmatimonadota bacterium]|nr:sulfite exporter TauE/SafE family protein [Gemmatimonadota bacterium]
MNFSDLPHQLALNPFLATLVLYAGGVMTSLTPCVYPMIPITASIIGGQTIGGASKRRVAALVASYAIGLSAVYSALGVFAGLSGTLFGSVSTNPWLYLLMANLLIAAALMMLDVIPVRLPAFVRRSSTVGKGGSIPGTFAMGAVSGLVAAPCSAPVMAVVLTWVATTKSGVLGFVYLLAFSLGMCTILVLVGLFAGALVKLPKAGVWMLWIKRALALIMIGVAEYYLMQMGQLLL